MACCYLLLNNTSHLQEPHFRKGNRHILQWLRLVWIPLGLSQPTALLLFLQSLSSYRAEEYHERNAATKENDDDCPENCFHHIPNRLSISLSTFLFLWFILQILIWKPMKMIPRMPSIRLNPIGKPPRNAIPKRIAERKRIKTPGIRRPPTRAALQRYPKITTRRIRTAASIRAWRNTIPHSLFLSKVR